MESSLFDGLLISVTLLLNKILPRFGRLAGATDIIQIEKLGNIGMAG
jgi:hypothetical protein